MTGEGGAREGGVVRPTRDEVGRAAWLLMHSAADAMDPQREDLPWDDQVARLRDLVASVAALFPCGECRGHFRGILAANEGGVFATRGDAARWIHALHNAVNARVRPNAPPFPYFEGAYALRECQKCTVPARSRPVTALRTLPNGDAYPMGG